MHQSYAQQKEVSSKGTDFWLSSTYPFYSGDSFLVAVSSSKPTKAYMEIPGFNFYDSLDLGYNEIKYFVVPTSIRRSYYYYHSAGGGRPKVGKNAIHVTSKLPVRVYAFSTGTRYSSGATAVYPSNTQPADGKYYPYKSRYQWNFTSTRYRIYFFDVVAIDDSVKVKLNFNNKSGVQIYNRPPGDSITLYQGEVVRFYMWAYNLNDEPKLSVQATEGKRISVFSENFYDFEDNGCSTFDLMYEQMMPENLLGKEFILTPIAFLKKGYRFSVSAVTDSTKIYKDGNLLTTLNKAEIFYSKVGGDSSVQISADKPITCWEKIDLDTCITSGWSWNNGGISLFTVNSNEQFVEDANILIPTGTDYPSNFINVIVPKVGKDSLYVDGQLILVSQLKPIINGDYYFFQDSARQGTIRVLNKYGFMAYAYGRGQFGGYAYNASSGLNSLKRVIETKSYYNCDSGFLISATSSGVPASNFEWNWNGTTMDTGLSTIFYAKEPGSYPIMLKYKRIGKSTYDSVQTIVVIDPKSNYDFIPVKDVKVCKENYTVKLPYSKILSYVWNDGDTKRTKSLDKSGTYTLTITNSETDCKIKDTIIASFFDTIRAKIEFSLASQCPGIPIYLANKSVLGSTDSIVKYQWFVDGQRTGIKANDTVPHAYPGNYEFKLRIENKAGCVDSAFATTYISDIPILIAGTKVLDSCVGTSNIRFNSQSRLSEGKIVSYRWIFSDGDTTHDWRQTIRTFNTAGTISYQFAAYTEQGCADTTAVQAVEIYKGAKPSFQIPDSIVCLNGNYFDIENTTADKTNGKRYLWYWGNGAGSALTDPGSVSYFDTGLFTIRMVGVDSATLCGGDTLDRNVRVLNTPVAKILVDSFNYCSNNNFYRLSDISESNGAGFKQTYWNWGNGSRDTSQGSFYKSFDTAGSYPIWMTHSIGKGCEDSVKKTLVVFQSPKANMIVVDSSLCAPNAFLDIANSSTTYGNARYLWSTKYLSSTDTDFGKINVLDTGLNLISLVVREPLYNCFDTLERYIKIYPNPALKIHLLDSEMCFPKGNFTLNDSTGLDLDTSITRHWSIGSDTFDQFPMVFSPTRKGQTTVSLIYQIANLCFDTIDARVTVLNENDSLKLSVDKEISCLPATFDFQSNPSTSTPWLYSWKTESVSTTGSSNYTHLYNSIGRKKMVIKGINGDCSLSDSIYINVLDKPVISISSNGSVEQCFKWQAFDIGTNINLATNPVTYRWLVPQNSFGNQTSIFPRFKSPGAYQVTVIGLDSNLCSDSANISIAVKESPKAIVQNDSACIGTIKSINYTINPADFSVKNYNWLMDGALFSQSNIPNFKYLNTSSSQVQLIIEGNNGCNDTSSSGSLSGLAIPNANFGAIVLNSTSNGVPVQFTNMSSGGIKYLWTFEKGANDTTLNPTYKYSVLGNKNVILKVWNKEGCFDTAQKKLFVTSDELGFIPSAFSPNQNGLNETFKPAQLSAVNAYNMKVFNRWGQIIFQTTNPNEGWNGNYMGKPVPEGVYGYQIFARFLTDVGFLKNGSIHLMR